MELRQALEIVGAPRTGNPLPVLLACGFTPLHLATFLRAHIQQARPEHRVQVKTGLFDDVIGTISQAARNAEAYEGVIVQLEWTDLDPRLGLRQLGGWGPAALVDLVPSVKLKLQLLDKALEELRRRAPVVLSGPLIEMPPIFHTVRAHLHRDAAEIESMMAAFLARFAANGVSVLNPRRAPALPCLDVRSHLSLGFPYTVKCASDLSEQLTRLLVPPPPRKGLITDLDGTLWKGILGEIGSDAVSWDLDSKAQIHGAYQALLQSMAEAGVLIAAASKNDPRNVAEALRRADLLISPRDVFPIEAGWGPKSESVARILRAWNIAEDDVVFVDDSAMELAEVSAAFPSITTLLFPSKDANAFWETAGVIRDLFGKQQLSQEDSIRSQSVRARASLENGSTSDGGDIDKFLAASAAIIRFEPIADDDERAIELINKTNQFNLNGVRRTKVEWRRLLAHERCLALAVSYTDKFGPLGKIAVLAGVFESETTLHLHAWVMSCRAFSRRIEFQCLSNLFKRLSLKRIKLDFQPSSKNGPIQQFLKTVCDGPDTITIRSFEKECPALDHRIEWDWEPRTVKSGTTFGQPYNRTS